ncbi:MAG TPA: hypothetical protein VGS00_10820 [Thermoanaerobaculia bacterium]|nr:hypothetical protein [Thermoanaerobaculia bacterium]
MLEKRGTKISLEVPPPILRAAKMLAIDEPGGLRGVIVRALEAYLVQKKALPAKRKG